MATTTQMFCKSDETIIFIDLLIQSKSINIQHHCNHLLLSSFSVLIIHVRVLYDLIVIPKSFITVNTAFRKDLSLQGCTMFTTRTVRSLPDH